MKPIAWIRPCSSEGAVLEWDKPHPADCADPTHLYHGPAVDARIAELTSELKNMIRGYVLLLENGRDRITSLGGSCDPVDVMEVGDHYLINARNALKETAP